MTAGRVVQRGSAWERDGEQELSCWQMFSRSIAGARSLSYRLAV